MALDRFFSYFCAAAGCSVASCPERSPSCRGHVCQGGCDAAPSTRQVLAIKKEVNPAELDFLLRFPSKAGVASPVDFLQPQGWGGIKVGLHGCPLCRGEASTAPSTVGPGSQRELCDSNVLGCRGPRSALWQAVGSAMELRQRQPRGAARAGGRRQLARLCLGSILDCQCPP